MAVDPTTTSSCNLAEGASCGCGAPAGADAAGGLRLSAFSRKERLALIAATTVVVAGVAAAALSPNRVGAAPNAGAAGAGANHQACATTGTAIAAVGAGSSVAATQAASEVATAAGSGTVATTTATAGKAAGTTSGSNGGGTQRPGATTRPARRPATAAAKPAPAKPAAPSARGLVVAFGTYDGAPVRWRVVAESDSELVLLSEYVISAGAFQSDWEGANANRYATSEVRAWLRDRFAANAFSAEESAALVAHAGGAAGSDRVFLLSASELAQYLPSAAGRKVAPRSSAAATQIGYSGEPLTLTGGYAGWWLADAAGDATSAKYVRADGSVGSQPVYYADLGVRPAIRLDRAKVALALGIEGAN